MAIRDRVYLVKPIHEGWEVLREGDRRASATAATQAEAVTQAKSLAKKEGRQVAVLGRSGKIAERVAVDGVKSPGEESGDDPGRVAGLVDARPSDLRPARDQAAFRAQSEEEPKRARVVIEDDGLDA